jgi:xylulose-5-phosphate/fructose-6-phosphate phosphoketolase
MSQTADAKATTERAVLAADTLKRMDGWWRAANYLSVGQIYLLDNPLLRHRGGPAPAIRHRGR